MRDLGRECGSKGGGGGGGGGGVGRRGGGGGGGGGGTVGQHTGGVMQEGRCAALAPRLDSLVHAHGGIRSNFRR